MLFKQSFIYNVDRSGSHTLKIFHCYHKLKKKYARIGTYIKGSVRLVERRPVKIRGKRFRPVKLGFIQRGFNHSSKSNLTVNNSVQIKSTLNGCIMIKRRGCLKSKYIRSPIIRPLRTKRFYYMFDTVI